MVGKKSFNLNSLPGTDKVPLLAREQTLWLRTVYNQVEYKQVILLEF